MNRLWFHLSIPTCRHLRVLIAAGVGFASLALPASAEERLSGPVPAYVERVVDGDTLRVRARIWLGQEVRVNVRLANIDTPELRGGCARERELAARARDHIQALLHLATAAPEPVILLYDINQDKFGGRVLARVTDQSGGDLSEALRVAGLARSYAGGKRGDWCNPQPHASVGMLDKN